MTTCVTAAKKTTPVPFSAPRTKINPPFPGIYDGSEARNRLLETLGP
jgi:hypothetical protein